MSPEWVLRWMKVEMWIRVEIWDAIYRTRYAMQSINDTAFTNRWNFALSLLLNSDKAEDIITHLEEQYGRHCEKYGQTRARILYRKDVLLSLAPIAKWIIHRVVAFDVLKRLIG